MKVFIADDHAVFRSGLRALLEKEPDIEVVGQAGTGTDTINAVAEQDVDVLVLDISMPGQPGPRVAEAVLAKKPSVAIVVLTVHEDEYYLKELFKIGARAFVLKRSTGVDLLQALRAASRGEQYVDPSLASHVISSYVGRATQKNVTGRLGLLTPREQEVCALLASGHTNPEIAQKLSISEHTVETHRANLMAKLNVKNRSEVFQFAMDSGLLKLR